MAWKRHHGKWRLNLNCTFESNSDIFQHTLIGTTKKIGSLGFVAVLTVHYAISMSFTSTERAVCRLLLHPRRPHKKSWMRCREFPLLQVWFGQRLGGRMQKLLLLFHFTMILSAVAVVILIHFVGAFVVVFIKCKSRRIWMKVLKYHSIMNALLLMRFYGIPLL